MKQGISDHYFFQWIEQVQNLNKEKKFENHKKRFQKGIEKLGGNPSDITLFSSHRNFGYTAVVSDSLFNKIRSFKFIADIHSVKDHTLKIIQVLKPYAYKESFSFGEKNEKCRILGRLVYKFEKRSDELFPGFMDKRTELDCGITFLNSWISNLFKCLNQHSSFFGKGNQARNLLEESIKKADSAIRDFEFIQYELESGDLSLSI